MVAAPVPASGDEPICKMTLDRTAIVCKEVVIEGDVTIGAGTAVHPFAFIKATNGPIVIGDNNVIEERVVIENLLEEGQTLIIGNENQFEYQSVIYAACIGNNNLFQVRSRLGKGCVVGNGCSVSFKCSCDQPLADMTVVYGPNNLQRKALDIPPLPTGQLEIVHKLLPQFHFLHKST